VDVDFPCKSCGQSLTIGSEYSGQQVECPSCRTQLTVPALSAAGDLYGCNNSDCGGVWTEAQLHRQDFQGRTVWLCPKCRLGVTKIVKEPSFWARAPGAFVYPFRGNGTLMLLLGTPLFALLQLASSLTLGFIAWIATVLVVGYFGMLLIDVIRGTASAEAKTMEWPDFTGYGDLAEVAVQIGLTALIVFSPVFVCLFLAPGIWLESISQLLTPEIWALLALAFTGLGLAYYPMALLAVVMFDDWAAVNPLRVVPAIVRAFLHYIVVLVLLGGLWLVREAGGLVLGALPLGWKFAAYLPVEFVTFYTLIVSARLLGLLYVANRHRLGWFD
jgi:hypothetical protein